MKKIHLALWLLFFSCLASAQEFNKGTPTRNKAVKWAPISLTTGSISLGGEYNIDRNSATLRLNIPVSSSHTIDVFENTTSFRMRSLGFLAGYRRYLSRKSLRGFYLEPFVNYVRHRSNGTGKGTLGNRNIMLEYNNRTSALGVGAQLGVQFIIKQRLVFDLFLLGPLMNYGKNNFFIQESGNNISWTTQETEDATKRINEFVDDLPFIRNHTTVEIDAAARNATARFKGFVPGVRTGFSVGFAF